MTAGTARTSCHADHIHVVIIGAILIRHLFKNNTKIYKKH
ncbi:hypothetical protein D083_0411 [Dickeya solani RNS 08.23.3.1.A]|nr:hypothetical protein D083_0411 [Dickeya solani RNS 08.23.3.1.A]